MVTVDCNLAFKVVVVILVWNVMVHGTVTDSNSSMIAADNTTVQYMICGLVRLSA